MNENLSKEKLAALEAARGKRKSAAERTAPEGYRSIEHFLDDVREYCGKAYGLQSDLATYLGVNRKTVSRWLSRQKIPMQPTIDAIAGWMRTKKAGL